MKSSDLTSVLQHQLDIANETIQVLLARIDDLGRTVEKLRAELTVSNLRRVELTATFASMQEALLAKNTDLDKQKRINKGLSKIIGNKSEKHKIQPRLRLKSKNVPPRGLIQPEKRNIIPKKGETTVPSARSISTWRQL